MVRCGLVLYGASLSACVMDESKQLCAPDCTGGDCLDPQGVDCQSVCKDSPDRAWCKKSDSDSSTARDSGPDAQLADGAMGTDSGPPIPCSDSKPCTQPDKPICAPTGYCVQCAGLSDCSTPAEPACVDSRCGDCTSNEQCSRFDDKPFCGPKGACVLCTKSNESACQGSSTPHCDPETNTCVACVDNGDCPNPAASVCDKGKHQCVPCRSDAGCAHVAGKGVCFDGACVECAGKKREACKTNGKEYVCDAGKHACDLAREVGSKTLCNKCVDKDDANCKARPDCVSDEECESGSICTNAKTGSGKMTAGAGKNVCLKVFSGAGACPRPFIGVPQSAVSVDGVAGDVCTFATDTTCAAHLDFRLTQCSGPEDDEACGVPGTDDGYCVLRVADAQYRCTVPCRVDELSDCPQESQACGIPGSSDLCAP